MTLNDFNVGDKVLFGRTAGEKTQGTVVGLGRTKLKVRQDETRGTMKSYPIGTVWTVPLNFVTKVGMTSAAPQPSAPVAPMPKRDETDALDFSRKAALLGLPTDCLNKWITLSDGKRVQILGLEPRRPSYPVSVQGTQGGRYKVPVAPVQVALNRAVAPAVKRDDAIIMQDILGIYCNLSPENLFMDGEISHSQGMKRAASFRARLRDLFRELGRTVSEDEAYGWPNTRRQTPV